MDNQKEYSCLEHNGKVLSKQIELENDYQETLPAYCDDIYRVVKCISRSYITSADINFSEIKVFGKVEICLTYYNESSNLCYVDFEEDFVKTVSAEGLSDSAFLCADIFNKYTNFRVINQRRIDIHNSSVICLNVYDKVKCPTLCSCENAKLKTQSVKQVDVISSNITRIEFDEEFSLPVDNEPIKRIISNTGYATLSEIKIIKDKALVKAVVNVSILYTPDNDSEVPVTAVYSFNVSKIIEAAGISDDDLAIANVNIGALFVKAKAAASDKINVIDIFGDVTLNTLFAREVEEELITDGYVPGFENEAELSDYSYFEAGEYSSENKLINMSFPLPDDVSSILELGLDVTDVNVKNLRIYARGLITAVCKSSGGEISCISSGNDIELPFENGSQAIASIGINSYDYTISPTGTIDVRLNACVNLYSFNENSIKLLSDISVGDNSLALPSVTVYFGKSGESVWDIAKSFSSDLEAVKAENDLSSDVLDSNKILIVPKA